MGDQVNTKATQVTSEEDQVTKEGTEVASEGVQGIMANNKWKIFEHLETSDLTSSDSDSNIPETAQSSSDNK